MFFEIPEKIELDNGLTIEFRQNDFKSLKFAVENYEKKMQASDLHSDHRCLSDGLWCDAQDLRQIAEKAFKRMKIKDVDGYKHKVDFSLSQDSVVTQLLAKKSR